MTGVYSFCVREKHTNKLFSNRKRFVFLLRVTNFYLMWRAKGYLSEKVKEEISQSLLAGVFPQSNSTADVDVERSHDPQLRNLDTSVQNMYDIHRNTLFFPPENQYLVTRPTRNIYKQFFFLKR